MVRGGAAEAGVEQAEVMLRDAYMMKGVSHENVSCVVMTCLDQPPLLIYTDLTGTASNLKTFLHHCNTAHVRTLLVVAPSPNAGRSWEGEGGTPPQSEVWPQCPQRNF